MWVRICHWTDDVRGHWTRRIQAKLPMWTEILAIIKDKRGGCLYEMAKECFFLLLMLSNGNQDHVL